MERKGLGVCKGIGMGTVVVVGKRDFVYQENAADIDHQKQRLVDSFAGYKAELETIANNASGELAEIFAAKKSILDDPCLLDEIQKLIASGKSCEFAVVSVVGMFADMFRASGDSLTMQRASDLDELRDGLLAILQGVDTRLDTNGGDIVLVAHDVLPAHLTNSTNLRGVVSYMGGSTSHSAIICKSLGIPAVFGVEIQGIVSGDRAIVDGAGSVIVHPTEQIEQLYKQKQADFLESQARLQKYFDKPTLTKDGVKVGLHCNIGNLEDFEIAKKSGAEGIGLFRTEFLYMQCGKTPPSEQFLTSVFEKVASWGKPVTIRTLDIGGDKQIPCLSQEQEDNPFLGLRAIRYCLQNQDIFLTQLRAILRASHRGNVKIMLPHITTAQEILDAKSLLEQAKVELSLDGVAYDRHIQLGIMIETPAAVMMASRFGKLVDFFSIGTNDLTQYTMVADRGNRSVAAYCNVFDPAVVTAIKSVIHDAKKAKIEVSMCGEAAAESLLHSILVGCGLDKYSVSAANVLSTRASLAQWSKVEGQRACLGIAKAETRAQVQELLQKYADWNTRDKENAR